MINFQIRMKHKNTILCRLLIHQMQVADTSSVNNVHLSQILGLFKQTNHMKLHLPSTKQKYFQELCLDPGP